MTAFLAQAIRSAAFGLVFYATAVMAGPNQAPVATMTSPASGSAFNAPATITLSANASDPDPGGSVARVEFYRGTTLIDTDFTSPYSVTWSNVAAGTYSVTAKAFDNLGKAGTSAAIQIQVIAITTTITAPAAGAVVSGSSVPVTGVFTGPDTTTVIVTAGGGHSTLASSGSGAFSATVELEPGSNDIVVQVARRDGTKEVVSRTVTAVSAPVVVMTGPTFYGPYTVPAQVALAADAASAQGTIQGVEFFKGTTSLGSAAGPPYTATTTLSTVGSHAIFARATDSFGFTADSVPLVLTAQSQPPTVQITSPAAGASFRAPATISLTATASDPDGTVSQVEYFRNGIAIPSPVTTAPYALTWPNVPVGTYLLTARARDNTGATGDSTGVSVTVVSNVAPTVSLTAPSGSVSYREPASVTFSATASDSDGTVSKVEFLLNDMVVGTVTNPPYTFTKPDVAAGSYVARARATDNDNGVTTSSTTASVNVAANALPSVAITAPAGGATFNAPTDIVITASASDSDGTIAKVEFFAGASLLGTVLAPSGSATWANAPLGLHTLTAKATDNDGGTQVSAPISITVNGITAAITAPADGASFTAPAAFDLSATASTSSGNITSMEFYDGVALIYTAPIPAGFATANYTLAMSAVSAGTHVYTVKAFDSGGRIVTSSGVTISVAPPPTPPAVTFTSPPHSGFYIAPAIVQLRANATAGSNAIANVEFYAGSTLIGSVSSPPYDLTWPNVPAGGYNLTARAIDTLGGATTSAPVAITVASAPSVSVTPGLDGSTVADDNVLVTGTVQTPANSAVTVNGRPATLMSDGRFFVNNLNLQPGTNSIAVTVTTQDGQSNTQTIAINSSGSAAFKVSIDPSDGLAPFDAAISVENPGNALFATIEFDTNGDGVADYTATSLESAQLTLNLPVPGRSEVRVTVKDAQGAVVFTTTRVVYAFDPIDRYNLLKGVYTDMLGRLKVGGIETALNVVSPTIRDQYRQLFISLGGSLASVVEQLGDLQASTVGDRFGELVITRTGPQGLRGCIVTLIKGDVDGIWRIDGM